MTNEWLEAERREFEAWCQKTHGNRALTDPDAGSMWSAWKARARKVPDGWQPIATAPKDGTPIVGWCRHSADPYFIDDGKRLTTYGGHTEGLGHVQDGPNVIVWGGAFDDSTWEQPGTWMPDWWFQYGSNFEVTANPTHWMPMPQPPKE